MNLMEVLDVIQKNKIRLIVDGSNLVFFFLFGNDVYGGSEDARVTFARMKNPDESGDSEANFTAMNLNKLGQGSQQQTFFAKKELEDISVIPKEEAYKRLEDFFTKEKEKKVNS